MPTDGAEPKKKVVYSSKKKRGKKGGKEEKKDEKKEEKDEEGSKDVWEVEKEEGKEEVEKEEQEEIIDTSKKGQEVAQPKKETKPVAHVFPGQEEDFNPQAKADATQGKIKTIRKFAVVIIFIKLLCFEKSTLIFLGYVFILICIHFCEKITT